MTRKRGFQDLFEYHGCLAERHLGLAPLGVGFLTGRDFPTGKVTRAFLARLHTFCLPEYTVNRGPHRHKCPVDNHHAVLPTADGDIELGYGEIRVLGDEDIFAAPDLIYHYITAHGYVPPPAFVKAVESGPQPGSTEHRAYVRTLR